MEFEGSTRRGEKNGSLIHNSDTNEGDMRDIISTEQLEIIEIVVYLILSGTVCLLGIVANIINLIIFFMQGLDTTMNISFFAMAISDCCSLITLEWLNINVNPFMEAADVPFEPMEIQYLTGGWPHSCFAGITCWITVFITIERCLCVAVPLKVKQIITPTRARIVICSVYFLMFLSLTPEYISFYFGQVFYPWRNETRIGLVPYKRYRDELQGFSFLEYTVISMGSFLTVVLFTCTLVIIMNRKTEWRQKSTSNSEQFKILSKRDKRAVKMVSLIAGVLITCFTPALLLHLTTFFEPDFDLDGSYANAFVGMWSFAFLSEAINASVNIFLYYRMSSKYRETFHKLFNKCIKYDPNDIGNLKIPLE